MSEVLQRIPAGPQRDGFLAWFQLADDAGAQIASYYQTGDLYVLRDPDGALGIVLVCPGEPGEVELKSVAVDPDRHGRGVGTRMVRLVLGELGCGATRATVATASCDLDTLAFYLKLGFRLWKVERDWFTPARGYPAGAEANGIPLQDRVWLDRAL